jgi:hypothetical protein
VRNPKPGGFPYDLNDFGNLVQIDPNRVLVRAIIRDFEPDKSFSYVDPLRKEFEANSPVRKLAPVLKPSEFSVSLAVHTQATAGTCPLCVHKEEEVSDEG